jgi:hypothetical protein
MGFTRLNDVAGSVRTTGRPENHAAIGDFHGVEGFICAFGFSGYKPNH